MIGDIAMNWEPESTAHGDDIKNLNEFEADLEHEIGRKLSFSTGSEGHHLRTIRNTAIAPADSPPDPPIP